jgi:site-specific DNA recombinase
MKAIGYIRVSTADQAQDGVSLEAQEAKVRAWADLNGYDAVEIFVDAGISGKRSDNRPGLQDALSSVSKGDAIVVYSLSRLARSTKDCLTISDTLMVKHADLVSLSEKIDTTTAAGKMVFRMLAVLAEFERDQVSERTKMALSYKKANGEKTGGKIPYGFSLAVDGKSLVPLDDEQAVIAQVQELKIAGNSLRTIARILSKRGFKARNGSDFSAMQVSRMAA